MTSPPNTDLAQRISQAALALGFCRVGFAAVEPLARNAEALGAWLEAGYHGEMAYMAAHASRDNPTAMLQEARSMVIVALAYDGAPDPAPGPLQGFVARYARGPDYHGVLKVKLRELAAACGEIIGRPVLARPCVDTAPLLERGYAERAGVGFAAKSTMAIVPGVGSYILLGELLLDIELPASAPAPSRCGRCTACLDACPTGAFVGPHVLDARRCISYLTIELRGPIPRPLRPLMGNMVFGCDICQQVCPFNASRQARPNAPELAPRPVLQAPALVELLNLGAAAYRKLVKGSAMGRTSRQQLARNAAVALGNSGDPQAVPPLIHALQAHPHALVRSHAAWALGQLGGPTAGRALLQAREGDPDINVREEAALGLAAPGA